MAEPGLRRGNPGSARSSFPVDLFAAGPSARSRTNRCRSPRARSVRSCGSARSTLFNRSLGLRVERRPSTRNSNHALPVRAGIFSRSVFGERKNLSLPHLECRRFAAVGKWARLAHQKSSRPGRDGGRGARFLWQARLRLFRGEPRHTGNGYDPHDSQCPGKTRRAVHFGRGGGRRFPLQDGAHDRRHPGPRRVGRSSSRGNQSAFESTAEGDPAGAKRSASLRIIPCPRSVLSLLFTRYPLACAGKSTGSGRVFALWNL
jgi:hypothetical protein